MPTANDPKENPESASVPRRVWSGTGLLVLGRVFGALCTMAVLALLSRHLPGEGFGRFTFYLAAFALLDALADFGTGAVAVQRTAHDNWAIPAVLTSARRIRVALATVGVAVVGLLVLALREPGGWWITLAALYPLTHALELSATVFKNRLAWGVPVAVRALAAAARLGIVLALFALGVESAALFLLGTAAASGLANVLLHLAARRHLPRPTIAIQPERGLLRAAWPLGVAGLCQQAYFHVDNLFVRAIEGLEPTGWYNGGVRLMSVLIMVAQFAPQVALPWLTRRTHEGDLGRACARLGQPLFALAGLGTGLLLPWREDVLRLLYGDAFAAAGASLGWLLAAAAAIYAGACLLTAVVATGSSRAVLAVAAAGLAVNVAGNFALVPPLGITGAGLATFATELAVAVGALWVLVRAGRSPLAHRPWLWLLGPVLFGAGAWLSGLFVSP